MEFIELFRGARKTRKIGAREVLFRQGDPGTEMFVLLAGSADILIGQTIVEMARPGTILGEMALIDDETRSATVVTRTPCHVVSLDKDDFDRLIHDQPQFARHVLKVVVQRLRRMNQALLASQTLDASNAANQPAVAGTAASAAEPGIEDPDKPGKPVHP